MYVYCLSVLSFKFASHLWRKSSDVNKSFFVKTKTLGLKTKTLYFVLEAPRDQDFGLEDYLTVEELVCELQTTWICTSWLERHSVERIPLQGCWSHKIVTVKGILVKRTKCCGVCLDPPHLTIVLTLIRITAEISRGPYTTFNRILWKSVELFFIYNVTVVTIVLLWFDLSPMLGAVLLVVMIRLKPRRIAPVV